MFSARPRRRLSEAAKRVLGDFLIRAMLRRQEPIDWRHLPLIAATYGGATLAQLFKICLCELYALWMFMLMWVEQCHKLPIFDGWNPTHKNDD